MDLSFSCQDPWRSCSDLQRSWQELWRSFKDLWKFFEDLPNSCSDLTKIFKDLSLSYQDPEQSCCQSSEILLKNLKILKDLGKKIKGPWGSWQEKERSLKILKSKLKILAWIWRYLKILAWSLQILAIKLKIVEDLGKNVIDPSKFWQENKQILNEKFMGWSMNLTTIDVNYWRMDVGDRWQ